jgi:hypothetical protein
MCKLMSLSYRSYKPNRKIRKNKIQMKIKKKKINHKHKIKPISKIIIYFNLFSYLLLLWIRPTHFSFISLKLVKTAYKKCLLTWILIIKFMLKTLEIIIFKINILF